MHRTVRLLDCRLVIGHAKHKARVRHLKDYTAVKLVPIVWLAGGRDPYRSVHDRTLILQLGWVRVCLYHANMRCGLYHVAQKRRRTVG